MSEINPVDRVLEAARERARQLEESDKARADMLRQAADSNDSRKSG